MAQSIQSQCNSILDLVKMWPEKDAWPYLKPVKKVEELFLEFTEMLARSKETKAVPASSKDMIDGKELKKWLCRLNMFRWCLELHNVAGEFSGLIARVDQCAAVIKKQMEVNEVITDFAVVK